MPELVSLLVEGRVEQALVEQAAAFVLSAADLVATAPVHLVHGDWSLPNLLTDGKILTGVVDWSGSRGGDPAADALGWEFWSSHGGTEYGILVAGYWESGGSASEQFELRPAAYRIAHLLDSMSHFLATDRPDLLERAKKGLAASVAVPPIGPPAK